jgi:predicted ferric reductase
MFDSAMWAFGRVSGMVALLMFTITLILGIVTRSGRPLIGMPRFSVTLIHRNTALLASVFLVLHVGTLLLDSYAKLRLVDVVVPFLGSFKPFWQGLGTVAFDLILAIMLTALLRRFVGVRAFKFVHWFTYAMWPVAVAHAIGNGTNGTDPWFLLSGAAASVLVVAAVIWRVTDRFAETSRARQESRLT